MPACAGKKFAAQGSAVSEALEQAKDLFIRNMADPRLGASGQVRKMKIADGIQILLDVLAHILPHHRHMVNVIKHSQSGMMKLPDDVKRHTRRVEQVMRVILQIVQRFNKQGNAVAVRQDQQPGNGLQQMIQPAEILRRSLHRLAVGLQRL